MTILLLSLVPSNRKVTVGCQCSLTEAVWLTHCLLWALLRHVPPTGSAFAASALGQIFDSTVLSRHAVRPVADALVGWSVKWTRRRFGEEWTRRLPKTASSLQVEDAPDSAPLA
jgi:hypothetical protein